MIPMPNCGPWPSIQARRWPWRDLSTKAVRIAHDDDIAFVEGWSELFLDVSLKNAPVHRRVNDEGGGQGLSQRRPAMKVCVFQCPNGTFESSLWPLRLRPRRRVILVVVPVSSRKTSRCGSSRMIGWRVKVHSSRAALCRADHARWPAEFFLKR